MGRPCSAIPPGRRLLVEPAPVRQAAEEDEVGPATTLAPSFGALEADAAAQFAPVRGIERSQPIGTLSHPPFEPAIR